MPPPRNRCGGLPAHISRGPRVDNSRRSSGRRSGRPPRRSPPLAMIRVTPPIAGVKRNATRTLASKKFPKDQVDCLQEQVGRHRNAKPFVRMPPSSRWRSHNILVDLSLKLKGQPKDQCRYRIPTLYPDRLGCRRATNDRALFVPSPDTFIGVAALAMLLTIALAAQRTQPLAQVAHALKPREVRGRPSLRRLRGHPDFATATLRRRALGRGSCGAATGTPLSPRGSAA